MVRAGLIKRATRHTLRPPFATSLREDGHGIREVIELLGHGIIKTIIIYARVFNRGPPRRAQ